MIFFGGRPCGPQHNNMHIVQWQFFHKTYVYIWHSKYSQTLEGILPVDPTA